MSSDSRSPGNEDTLTHFGAYSHTCWEAPRVDSVRARTLTQDAMGAASLNFTARGARAHSRHGVGFTRTALGFWRNIANIRVPFIAAPADALIRSKRAKSALAVQKIKSA